MRKIIALCCVLLIIGCKTKKKVVEEKRPTLEIVSTEEVSQTLKNKAYSLGKRVLMTCNTSRFKPFTSEEATTSVIKNTTQEKLTRVCHKFRVKYGNFKDIYLTEVLKNNIDDSYVFRYKAKYERDFAKKELRVTLDKNNKVSAIKSSDWVDKINEL
ncbi:hypothetical protein [Flavobacterium sp.]|uniref:hypothetical protein n=1 Tax=Flavobacterium sp. TaxID=239 RepID=UPI0026079EBE|nr:hypothetical protein [Flavobacterium sp.]MDD3005257.1 hypothetical protein [Flavobacterium sp.]